MDRNAYQHELVLDVRDYECDLQGIVNNANYQHYLEHARHKWLASLGLSFAELHEEGIDLIVVRIEMDFRSPLRSGDSFAVRSKMHREGRLRIICEQDIFRIDNDQQMLRGRVTATALQNGRPTMPEVVIERLAPVLTAG